MDIWRRPFEDYEHVNELIELIASETGITARLTYIGEAPIISLPPNEGGSAITVISDGSGTITAPWEAWDGAGNPAGFLTNDAVIRYIKERIS